MIILRNTIASVFILLCFLFYTEFYKTKTDFPLIFNEKSVEFHYQKYNGLGELPTKRVSQKTKKSSKNQTPDMRLIGDHGGNGHSLKKSRNLPRSAFGATHSNQTDDFSITFTEIDSYVSARQENKTVMITICDKGYLSIFRLFYRINKMEQYSNFIVFVLDKDGYNILSSEGYPAFYYKNDVLSQRDASQDTKMWTSSSFDKMVLKVCIIRDLLNLNYKVLYLDSDVFLFKNPFPFLSTYDTQAIDYVAQKDDDICAGLMFLYPTVHSKRMLTMSIRTMYQLEIMDQDAIVFITHAMKNSIHFEFLPSHLFMSGRDYAFNHQFIGDKHESDGDIIAYHNNYIIFGKNKLYRWREQGLYLEDDSYYSQSPNGYLYVDSIDGNWVRSLRKLVTLVNTLNRTLIMPKFPCPSSVNRTYCNICSLDDCCANGFQHFIHHNFKAHQILYDSRSPKELIAQFQTNEAYEYSCSKNSKTTVDGHKIILAKKFHMNDLNQFKGDRNTLLVRVKNIPTCIPEKRYDIRGYFM